MGRDGRGEERNGEVGREKGGEGNVEFHHLLSSNLTTVLAYISAVSPHFIIRKMWGQPMGLQKLWEP